MRKRLMFLHHDLEQDKIPTSTAFTQHNTRHQSNQPRERSKEHLNYYSTDDMILYTTSPNSKKKKTLECIKIAEYKINSRALHY